MEDNQNNPNDTILFVSGECIPFCANGGVADMCYALPKYLNRFKNVDARVILPLYSKIPEIYRKKFTLVGERTVELSWRQEYCGVYEYVFNGITYYFIDNKYYFDRENLFGYDDDVERFSFFSKAVLDILPIINFFPDIIHSNDWQSGMVCTFLKVLAWKNPKYEHIKTVLAIHNLIFQGIADFKVVKDLFGVEDKFAYLFDFFGKANLTKAAILCTDKIVTVSESYKNEILNTDIGGGLQGILQSVSYKLYGITNGIDYEFYNPATDPNIFEKFDANNIDKRIVNKLKLQELLNLEVDENIPTYCYIGYMAGHKGLDLILLILENYIKENKLQFVVLGGGNTEFQKSLIALSEKYPKNVSVTVGYDSRLAKKIYAGSDFLFNVSKIEPCGLCPLIANRYGCMPIVSYIGGLKDNFVDYKYTNGNGYILKSQDPTSFQDLINRTLRHYKEKDRIKNYIISGMNQNFDIINCAKKYLKLYREMEIDKHLN